MVRAIRLKAIERLRKAHREIPEPRNLQSNSPKFKKWRRNTKLAISHVFGSNSKHVKDFNKFRHSLATYFEFTSDKEIHEAYVEGLELAAFKIESMIEEIDEYWDEDDRSHNSLESEIENSKQLNRVFVVHGHDDSTKEKIARYLEKLKLTPIILHEQSNQGRTITEKFEDHADVGFGVVLLSPDDVGAPAKKWSELKSRARQNVVSERRFFVGRLDRKRVFVLVKGDVETPSNYDGVVYAKLDDNGGWRMELVRELKESGFNIDANLAFLS